MKLLKLTILYSYVFYLHANAFNIDECNTKKKCITFPNGCLKENSSNCDYLVSYAPSENNAGVIDIELVSKIVEPDNAYVAVGFSDDPTMGEEPVSICSFVDANVTVHLTKNIGKSNEPANNNPLILLNGKKENGHYYCKFQQESNKNFSNSRELPDLSLPHFLLVVRGPIHSPDEPQRIGIHETDPQSNNFPKITPNQIVLSDPLSSLPPASSSADYRLLLVRIHGLLMVVAWLFLLAVGIFSARYVRDLWPTATPMGLKIWFHIHRSLNFIAVCCLVLSTILIFIAKDITWKGPWFGRDEERNLSYGAIHSLVGLLSVIGAVAQPFLALTRCDVNHPRRSIFNWIHRIIGLAAFVLALAAIFIAVIRFKRYWADQIWSLIALIVYYILIIATIIVSEWYRIKREKPLHPGGGVEMKPKESRQNYIELHSNASQLNDTKIKRATIGLFFLFVLIASLFTGFLFYMLLPY